MKLVRVLACSAMLIMLCGCFDYNELNMQEQVNGAGIDSEGDKVNVHVLCVATSGEEDKQGAVYTASGGSFFEAVREISGQSDKKLYWGHARVLIIGEAAADSINEVLDTVLRAQDVYLDIAPVIAKQTTAQEIISSKPAGGRDVADSIFNMFANEDNSRHWKSQRVWEILREREISGVYILPTVTVEGESPKLAGGAVISDGKLSGYLSGEQMLILSMMTERGAGGYLPPIIHGENSASFEILANEVKIEYQDGKAEFTQNCVLSPAEVHGDITVEEMGSAAKRFLEDNMYSLAQFAKANSLGDIFGLSAVAHEWVNIAETDFSVKCDVRISNILGGK